jgi:hypothetical protein
LPGRIWLVLTVALVAIGLVLAARASLRDGTSPPEPSPETFPAGARNAPPGPPWYEDVTARSGLRFTHRNGEEANEYTILESLGGGVALIDYDGDGRLDIFVTGGGYFAGNGKKELKGHPCKLYRNLGGFRFEDVTEKVGLDRVDWWYTHGAAVADYDRDGEPDLLVTGYGRIALFRNERDGQGGRRFVDVSEKVGLRDGSWATSAGWADIDGDGYPEIYVCHYCDWSLANNPPCSGQKPEVQRDVCPPQKFKPLIHSLFRNEAGKKFRDTALEHGFEATGCGLGVVLLDINDDGRPDVYVGNDASNNFLFFNRGGKLQEKGLLAGAAVNDEGKYDGSMGVDAGDFEGTGRPALWVTNFQGDLHALYRNLGRERFQHISKAAGFAAFGQHLVGFGTGFVDADNDGWEDIAIAHGHVIRHPVLGSTVEQLPMLLRNVDFEGRRFYRNLGPSAGPYFDTPVVGRGLAIGDLDNDGWPDLVVSHTNSPVAVLQNVVKNHMPASWIGVSLEGRNHRDLVGSTVIIETASRKLTRFVKGGGSYLSANDPRLLFGLGKNDEPRKVTVKWSWCETQTWSGLEPGAYWQLQEGSQSARKIEARP